MTKARKDLSTRQLEILRAGKFREWLIRYLQSSTQPDVLLEQIQEDWINSKTDLSLSTGAVTRILNRMWNDDLLVKYVSDQGNSYALLPTDRLPKKAKKEDPTLLPGSWTTGYVAVAGPVAGSEPTPGTGVVKVDLIKNTGRVRLEIGGMVIEIGVLS